MIIGKAVLKEIRKKLMNNHIKTEQSLHAVMVVQFFYWKLLYLRINFVL